MKAITKKTTSRLAAVQTIYQYEINSQTQSHEMIMQELLDFYESEDSLEEFDIKLDKPIKLNIDFFKELVKYTVNNLEYIDLKIKEYLSEGWVLEKINYTLLAILRVGIAELKYFPETPYKVIIDEYTNIASDLLKDKDIGFVNSLLENAAKELRTI